MSVASQPIPPLSADVDQSGTSAGARIGLFSATNVFIGALAMLATLPGRTHGLGLITEPLLADLELDRNTYAQINLVATLVGALGCFPAGMLIDRLGTRWSLVIIASALGCTCWAMCGVATIPALAVYVTLTRFFGQSALSVVSMAVVGKWFRRGVSQAMAVYSLLVGVGFMLAFTYVGKGINAAVQEVGPAGWRAAWQYIALAILLGLVPLAALLVRPGTASPATDEDHAPRRLDGFTFTAALRRPAFWTFALATSMYGLVSSGLGLFNQAILAEHHFKAETYYETLSLAALAGLGGQLAAGLLTAKISLPRLLALAMFIYAAALLWLTRIETLLELRAYAIMMGVTGGIITVLFFAVWPKAFGRLALGRIQGAAQMLTVIASAVGPLVFSTCYDQTQSYSPALYALVPIVFALGLAAWIVPMPSLPKEVST